MLLKNLILLKYLSYKINYINNYFVSVKYFLCITIKVPNIVSTGVSHGYKIICKFRPELTLNYKSLSELFFTFGATKKVFFKKEKTFFCM